MHVRPTTILKTRQKNMKRGKGRGREPRENNQAFCVREIRERGKKRVIKKWARGTKLRENHFRKGLTPVDCFCFGDWSFLLPSHSKSILAVAVLLSWAKGVKKEEGRKEGKHANIGQPWRAAVTSLHSPMHDQRKKSGHKNTKRTTSLRNERGSGETHFLLGEEEGEKFCLYVRQKQI